MDDHVRDHLKALVRGDAVPAPFLPPELTELTKHAPPSRPAHSVLPSIWAQLSQLVPDRELESDDTGTSGAANVLLQHLDSAMSGVEQKNQTVQMVIDILDPRGSSGGQSVTFDADTASAVLVDMLGFELVELVAMLVANPHATAAQLRRAQALRAHGVGSAKEPLSLAPSSGPQETYPNVFNSGEHGSVLSAFGTRFALPMGTQRIHNQYYEEVSVPRSQPMPFRSTERLVTTEEMDPLCRGAFRHYKTLNRLQSAVYPMAYKTHENLLVCAPTGAGKTDVAMLSILQCISRYMHYSERDSIHVDKSAFKIVYVAPMKALVSEIVSKFQKRLAYLGLQVRELTGDMQLTRKEISETQMIVTTPEKWDVVTRKPTGDGDLALSVRLLIIDEVHLLHEERGSVIETIVARTQRLVESTQSMIRIVGLSATLPNFVDVADFLSVNRYRGLFYFGAAFRPVPLEQHFIGVRGKHGSAQSRTHLDRVAYEKVMELVREGHPVMVFVHTRKDTVKTAQTLLELGKDDDLHSILVEGRDATRFERDVTSSRNRELRELFEHGIGIHHAGMLRSDRDLSERLFAAGATRVLCCTATLAWGVNLPAYAVIIKGTDVYDAEQGKMVDLGILDVLQIFGRAGRPQYEDVGVSYICTSSEKLPHYIEAITSAHPIESTFLRGLVDALNAEIALGSVSSLDDGVSWLGFTYLFTRLRKAPLVYGLDAHDLEADPTLVQRRRHWISYAARVLVQHQMIVFDTSAGTLRPTNMGRIASRYYLSHKTIGVFHERLRNHLGEADALDLMSRAADFEQIPLRESEEDELKSLLESVPCEVAGGTATAPGKVNILFQAHVSYLYIDDFALVSDARYVAQNAGRVLLALFELALDRGFAASATAFLQLAKAVDKRIWPFEHPLRQYPTFSDDMKHRISTWADDLEVSQIRTLPVPSLAQLLHTNERIASVAHNAAERFPSLHVRIAARPTPSAHVRLDISVWRTFVWDERIHGASLPIVWWVQDATQRVVYMDRLTLRPTQGSFDKGSTDNVSHPFEREHGQYQMQVYVPLSPADVRPTSEAACEFVWSSLHWLHAEGSVFMDVDHLECPLPTPSTTLLPLPLLPLASLQDMPLADGLGHVHTLNAIQTQVFHTLSHSRANVLLCAPYGSGKWTAALFAIARAFKQDSEAGGAASSSKNSAALLGIILIIEPDAKRIGSRVDTLTKLAPFLGDINSVHASSTLEHCVPRSIVIMTPADAANALSGATAAHAQLPTLSLVVCLHIHKLTPAYELAIMQIRRTQPSRFIATAQCLSTAASFAAWLHIPTHAMYAFAPSDTPYPVSMSFDTVDIPYSETLVRAYAKPAFDCLETHEGEVGLLFAPTRAQCITAAQELTARFAMKGFTAHPDVESAAQSIQHQGLAHLVRQGLAFWHTNLSERDRSTVERLADMRWIRAVLCSFEAAEDVPIQTSLVIVLGTQYTTHASRHVQEYSLEQLWSMQRHAVRPNSTSGEFHVLCQQQMRPSLERLLQAPLAVESSLSERNPSVLEALAHEVMAQRVMTRRDIVMWLSTSYLAVRVRSNPAWYGVPGENERTDPSSHVSSMADALLAQGERLSLWHVDENDHIHASFIAQTAPPRGIQRLCAFVDTVLLWRKMPDAVHHQDIFNVDGVEASAFDNDGSIARDADQANAQVRQPEGLQENCAKTMLEAVDALERPTLPRIVLAHWLTPLVSTRTLYELDQVLILKAGGHAADRIMQIRHAILRRIMSGPGTPP